MKKIKHINLCVSMFGKKQPVDHYSHLRFLCHSVAAFQANVAVKSKK